MKFSERPEFQGDPFPERTNEELIQDVYGLLVETVGLTDWNDGDSPELQSFKMAVAGPLFMSGVKLEKLMGNLNIPIPERSED